MGSFLCRIHRRQTGLRLLNLRHRRTGRRLRTLPHRTDRRLHSIHRQRGRRLRAIQHLTDLRLLTIRRRRPWSLSSYHSSASDGSVHLHHPILVASVSAHYRSQTETPPGEEQFFNKDVKKKLHFFAGVAVISGFIAKVASSSSTRRDYHQYS
jgi:hypothetical protein